MNWETEKEMAADVEEREELYAALADGKRCPICGAGLVVRRGEGTVSHTCPSDEHVYAHHVHGEETAWELDPTTSDS